MGEKNGCTKDQHGVFAVDKVTHSLRGMNIQFGECELRSRGTRTKPSQFIKSKEFNATSNNSDNDRKDGWTIGPLAASVANSSPTKLKPPQSNPLSSLLLLIIYFWGPSHSPRLSLRFNEWTPTTQPHTLAGWMDGDGWQQVKGTATINRFPSSAASRC